MKFGICCSPASLGDTTPGFLENIALLESAGVEYLEFPVAAVVPEGEASVFDELQGKLADAPLRVEAFNSFLPSHQRITGPEVNLAGVLEYSRSALSRCKALGGDVVVLGSAKARSVPEGFDALQAEEQFIAFCRELGPIAQDSGVTICIEPLNSREDNLILSVAHGARIVDEIGHPAIQLLADFYHMMQENEPLENVTKAGGRLHHTHLADIGRVVPGFAAEGEADFVGFFRALNDAGYAQSTPEARCSFEGRYEDMMSQASPMIALLHQRYQAA